MVSVRHPVRIAAIRHDFGEPVDEPETPLDRRQRAKPHPLRAARRAQELAARVLGAR
jgi:hypothetical protein